MAEVIEYPFDIDYKVISQGITKSGVDFIKAHLASFNLSESVVNIIIKQALKRGWGS